jgi:hypothetical protein
VVLSTECVSMELHNKPDKLVKSCIGNTGPRNNNESSRTSYTNVIKNNQQLASTFIQKLSNSK